MAKSRHNNNFDTIHEIFKNAKENSAMHFIVQESDYGDDHLKISNRKIKNFGTCGYLGLEKDERIIDATIEAVKRFGTQFSVSQAYLIGSTQQMLENTMHQLFQKPVLISSSTSLIHLGIIPILVRDEDLVLYDHQVHASVQNALSLLKPRGITVEIVKHNDMDYLESKIIEKRNRFKKIWYAIDGIYSMHGNPANIIDILYLLDKYPQLNLYVDDAHGIGWSGKNGVGYSLSKIKFHERLTLTTTMGKGMGVSGGIAVFHDQKILEKMKLFSGAVSFSHPLSPPLAGAANAAAKIFLSDELPFLQSQLKDKIEFASLLIKQAGIPLKSSGESPIFFIEVGKPLLGYKIVSQLMSLGYFTNLAVYPAVPIKSAGIRFTITLHNSRADISDFVECLSTIYKTVMEEDCIHLIGSAIIATVLNPENKKKLTVLEYTTILNVPKDEWNQLFAERGSFDWEGLKFQEEVFKNNVQSEYNWDIDYILIKDEHDEIILATFYSTALWKEDMLAPPHVSKFIEKIRMDNPYFLVSKAVSLGTFFTEGEHLYLNKKSGQWEEALTILLSTLEKQRKIKNSDVILLRDFSEDKDVHDFFLKNGYFKVDVPETAQFTNFNWKNTEEFIETLSYKSRKHFRKEIEPYTDLVHTQIKKQLSSNELIDVFKLFQNVNKNNFDVNLFPYPFKLFQKMAESDLWEFLLLYLNNEKLSSDKKQLVGVMFIYKSQSGLMCPMIVGLDYDYLQDYNIYRQLLFQTICRAHALNCTKINFGITANFEKKKLGAIIIPRVCYLQTTDNFKMEQIDSIY